MDTSAKNGTLSLSSLPHGGERLDVFLAHSKEFSTLIGESISRSRIVLGIKKGGALLKENPLKPDTRLSRHDTLAILPDKFVREDATLLPEPDLPITLIEANPDFLVIDKPAGIQVHPSASQKTGTLVQWIIAHFPETRLVGDPLRPGIVHRLDKDTSGLLLIARTKRAFTTLKNLFKNRKIEKRYLALVFGVPATPAGVIETPIARAGRGDRQTAVLRGKRVRGVIRPAETHYRVLETFATASLIEVLPKTGRTHQIRVHLASIGHPVLGDTLYASALSRASSKNLSRHLLHATSLSFDFRGKKHAFESALPKDFAHRRTLYKNKNPE